MDTTMFQPKGHYALGNAVASYLESDLVMDRRTLIFGLISSFFRSLSS